MMTLRQKLIHILKTTKGQPDDILYLMVQSLLLQEKKDKQQS